MKWQCITYWKRLVIDTLIEKPQPVSVSTSLSLCLHILLGHATRYIVFNDNITMW